MLFASGFNGSASLTNTYITTFAGDTVYTRDFQTQFVLGRSKHMISSGWNVDGFDIVFSK
jgi:hypothetical protein